MSTVARRNPQTFRDIARLSNFSRKRSAKIWIFPSRDILLNRWEHSREGSDWVDDIQGHPRGRVGRSWRTRQDVRRYAAEKGLSDEAAIEEGLEEKAAEFAKAGEVYQKV